MFNVLPEDLKNKVRREYRLRVWIVTLTCVLVVEGMFLVFLFPSIIVSWYKEQEVEREASSLTQSATSTSQMSLVHTITTTNNTLGILGADLTYPVVRPYIDAVVQAKPGTIHIFEFTYTSDPASASLTIQGTANARQDLVSFVKNLQNTNLFTHVDLPVSDLAKDTNIQFTLTVTFASHS